MSDHSHDADAVGSMPIEELSRFRALFEASGEAILLFRDHNVVECNLRAQEVFGCTREHLIGSTATQLAPPVQPDGKESHEIIAEQFERALQGSTQHFEWHSHRMDGSPFPAEITATHVDLPSGGLLQTIVRDISDRKHSETTLRSSERFMHRLLHAVPSIVYVFDIIERRVVFFSPNAAEILGYAPDELEVMGDQFLRQALHPDDTGRMFQSLTRWQSANDDDVFEVSYRVRSGDGSWRWIRSRDTVFQRNQSGRVCEVIGTAHDVTREYAMESTLDDRERQLHRANQVLRTLWHINKAVLRADDLDAMLEKVCKIMVQDREYAFAWIALETCHSDRLHLAAASEQPAEMLLDFSIEGGEGPRPLCAATAYAERRTFRITGDMKPDPCPDCPTLDCHPDRATLAVPLRRGDRCLGVLVVHGSSQGVFDDEETALLEDLADSIAYAIESLEATEQRRRRANELALLNDLTRTALEASDVVSLAAALEHRLTDAIDQGCCRLILWDEERRRIAHRSEPIGEGDGFFPGADAVEAVLDAGTPVTCDDLGVPLPESSSADPTELPGSSILGLPLIASEQRLGVAFLVFDGGRTCLKNDLSQAEQVAGHVALAVARTRAMEADQQRVQTLLALHETGVDLAGRRDLHGLLEAIVDRACRLLETSMGGLYLLEPDGLRLTVAKGVLEPYIGRCLEIGEGASGKAVERRRQVVVDDYQRWADRAPMYRDLPVRSVISAPILWHDDVLGALHLEHIDVGRFGRQARELVNLFADQAAVAIANARLFDDLGQANVELAQAYDSTLEGWVRALDLRDQETEGHTQRVTEMTLRLAREVDVPEHELVHYRRGALLHDIGKIGIPDRILRKPGPLTDEEHCIMRTHPSLAWEMLSPISYLRPSLVIPVAHHERWDGSGYPRGLQGERIPLSARIFAVVDVYDALRFDRPYRTGWDHVRVVEHLVERAGKDFDPAIVRAFVAMLDSEEASTVS